MQISKYAKDKLVVGYRVIVKIMRNVIKKH